MTALPDPTAPTVILLHGIWMRGFVTAAIGARLKAAGLRVLRFDYASVNQPFVEHVDALDRLVEGAKGRVHWVGHSLGGLLAVHYLQQREKLLPAGRVVCLGAPLRGSTLARRIDQLGLGAFGLGFAREPLLDGFERYTGKRDLGVIAGNLALGLQALFGRLEGDSDGTVRVEETRLPGITDHTIVAASHSGLLLSRKAAEMTVRFLRQGSFGAGHEGTRARKGSQ